MHILRHCFDGRHIHERLASEEVHLTMPARAAGLDQIVYRTLAGLWRHDRPFLAVAAAIAKAIFAAQIAVLRNHQAQ